MLLHLSFYLINQSSLPSTITKKTHSGETFPSRSDAMYRISVCPTGKLDPLIGPTVWLTKDIPELSSDNGEAQVTGSDGPVLLA